MTKSSGTRPAPLAALGREVAHTRAEGLRDLPGRARSVWVVYAFVPVQTDGELGANWLLVGDCLVNRISKGPQARSAIAVARVRAARQKAGGHVRDAALTSSARMSTDMGMSQFTGSPTVPAWAAPSRGPVAVRFRLCQGRPRRETQLRATRLVAFRISVSLRRGRNGRDRRRRTSRVTPQPARVPTPATPTNPPELAADPVAAGHRTDDFVSSGRFELIELVFLMSSATTSVRARSSRTPRQRLRPAARDFTG